MPVWELCPLDSDDRNWGASTYNGPAVIRAPDETRAREIATLAFIIATYRIPGEEFKLCPWGYAEFVRCRQMEDSRHDDDGPDAILEPAEYDHDWR